MDSITWQRTLSWSDGLTKYFYQTIQLLITFFTTCPILGIQERDLTFFKILTNPLYITLLRSLRTISAVNQKFLGKRIGYI